MPALSLLAVITDAPDDEAAVAVAADIAVRRDARAGVIAVLPVPSGLTTPVFAGAVVAPQVWQSYDAQQKALEAKAAALVERYRPDAGASSAGPAPELFHIPTQDGGWTPLMAELALVDLVVIAQSNVTGEGPWIGPLGEALMDARAPVYVARDSRSAAGRPAAIAWDGSLEAGRAVRAAVPLLCDASWVAVLQVPARLDTSPGAAADPQRVAAYLARHGVAVKDVIKVGGPKIGSALLAAAKGADAGLLVAGAYHHSRLQEALFGGATRDFLGDAQGPHMLIAH
jgi:nucleotide-binding universal stress UspA family protein